MPKPSDKTPASWRAALGGVLTIVALIVGWGVAALQ